MRRHRLLNILSTTVMISMGIVMLIGLLSDSDTPMGIMATFTLQFVKVVIAIAVALGLLNLLAVHFGRMRRGEYGWPYSLIAVLTAIGIITLRVLDRAEIWSGDLEGEQMSERVFEAVQVSLESALAALLVFFLVYAAYRLMRRRVTIWHLAFSLTAMVVLVGFIPLDNLDVLRDTRDWLVRIPAGAGARGILIGVGLGTVTVGARVLLGQDRSYRD